MSFSISKLQNLIQANGFIPISYFIIDGMCFYVELYSTQTGEVFFMYIPSKYEFVMSENDITFKMKYINNKDLDNISDDGNIEDRYMSNVMPVNQEDIEEQLEDNYKHSISLKNISVQDLLQLKSIFQQLKRLKYSVQNLKYKLGIVYKNYLCAIRRDNSINCFYLKNYSKKKTKRIIIIVDLECFYLKIDRIAEDIGFVKNSLYRILSKNQGINSEALNSMLSNIGDMTDISYSVEVKQADNMARIQQIENMLSVMKEAYTSVQNNLKNFQNGSSVDNINNDINRVYKKNQLEKELQKINKIRQSLLAVLIELKEKCDDDFINTDNLLFDNNVMWERMTRNFAMLKSLS